MPQEVESSIWISVGAIVAGLAVIVGAFGAHALPNRLEAAGVSSDEVARRLDRLEIGARYQMYHALAIVAVGLVQVTSRQPTAQLPAWLFVVGIVLFSGSLYAIAATGINKFGMITPIGGLCFIAAWLLFALRR